MKVKGGVRRFAFEICMPTPRTSLLAALVLGFAVPAAATWVATDYHPPGAGESVAHGIRNGKFVGLVDSQAALWNVNSLAWTSLGPGVALKTDGVQQVGFAPGLPLGTPSLWQGTSASQVLLTHTGVPSYGGGSATGVFAGQQCGYSISFAPGFPTAKAGFWLDTAGTWTNLQPAGIPESRADDTHNGAQVGVIRPSLTSSSLNAALWYNSAGSMVNLNPGPGFDSWAYSVFNGQQAGYYAVTNGPAWAARWSGSAASMVSLHPSWAYQSRVFATYLGRQAGIVELPSTYNRAAYWENTAASCVNLHDYLPPGYSESEANGVWRSNAGYSYVTGYARVTANGARHAILWRQMPDQILNGTLNLQDTVSAFGYSRAITYTISNPSTPGVPLYPGASGTITAYNPTTPVHIPVLQSVTGLVLITFDGSSFLKRKLLLNLTGSNQPIGTVSLQNGDADLSGEVDAADLDAIIADFGLITPNPTDVDASGEVDAADIDVAIANFGGVDD